MNLQEVAVAIGLLTPLVLGVLAFIEKLVNRKKDSAPIDPQDPPVVQGLTVATETYAEELIAELRKERDEAETALAAANIEINLLKAELRAYKERE